MTIAIGDRVPEATLARMGPDGPVRLSTTDYFTGRRVALFCVPGAFTPTCSARHLPGFVEKADAIRAKQIDEIAALAVNDIFVMDAWGKSAGAEGKVTMLADGNGDFVRALGLEFDGSGFGMGVRGKRFSMLVDHGKVEALFVEAPGEFRVSSAEHLLQAL
jgi:glutaredoxin/glutathione-dependent peroxiredoxin